MGQIPMDVEQNFNWGNKKERKDVCGYLAPLKKRKIEASGCLDGAQMVKYAKRGAETLDKKAKIDVSAMSMTLVGYLHLISNFVVVSLLCYASIYVLVSIQGDIRHKITDKRMRIEQEINETEKLYKINKCDPSTRVPAMEDLCNRWECVIKNGYGSVGYTRIIAEVFGDVIDGFVRKFSIRSSLVMGFFFIIFLVFRKTAKA